MRILVIFISLFISTAAHANDEAVANLERAIYAINDGRPYDAYVHYRNAIHGGLPDALIPIAETGYCITRAWMRIDKEIMEYCGSVLRHGGASGQENAELLAGMLSELARFSIWAEYYKTADDIITQFDRRYKDMDFPYLIAERQRIDIARAEVLRVNRKPREAIEIVERIVKDSLIQPEGVTRNSIEMDGVEVMKTLLFATSVMGDQAAIRDSIERFDKMALQIRSAEGAEYASVVMLCGVDILVKKVGLESRKIYGEVLDRTRISMGLLVKSHDLNRQRPLLMVKYYIHLMQECGPSAFYKILPANVIKELRQKNAGEDDFKQIFDHYAAERYTEAAAAFDRVIAGLNEYPETAAWVSADHLKLLRKYLLNPPGRTAPG